MWRRRSYLRSGYPPGVIERSPRSGRSSEHASGFGAVLRVLTVHTVSTSPFCCERANQLDTNKCSFVQLARLYVQSNGHFMSSAGIAERGLMVAVSRGGSMSERMRVLKWLALVVVVVLALGLVATGCGSEDEETTTTEAEPSDDGSTEATETTEAAAEEPEQTTLKYAFFAPASTFPAVQMEKW